MREQVLEYLKKPTKKALSKLTSMEQKWVKAKDDGDKKPDPKPNPQKN